MRFLPPFCSFYAPCPSAAEKATSRLCITYYCLAVFLLISNCDRHQRAPNPAEAARREGYQAVPRMPRQREVAIQHTSCPRCVYLHSYTSRLYRADGKLCHQEEVLDNTDALCIWEWQDESGNWNEYAHDVAAALTVHGQHEFTAGDCRW